MKTVIFIIMFLIAPLCSAQVTEDTIIISHRDSSYTLHVLYVAPDSLDSNHVIEFGYDHLGLGWITRAVMPDSDGVAIPTFIYMEDPKYRYDVNRDGKVNIGDVVWLIKYIFGGSE